MALGGRLSSFVSTLDAQKVSVHHTFDKKFATPCNVGTRVSAVLLGPVEEQQQGTHGVLGRFPAVKQWSSITQFCNLLNDTGV